jgi:alkyl hydroperoxide reductase subunit AhpC
MQPGTSAPSFTACSYSSFTKERVNVELASLHGGYTVLFFYPVDFGPLMLADLMDLQEAAKELLEDKLNMLAISTDTWNLTRLMQI